MNFYTIDARGLHTIGDEMMDLGAPPQDPSFGINPQSIEAERRLSADSLKVLAEQTGGYAAVERNDYAEAFDRIQRENSSYYVLGYYPPSDKRDGRYHRIEVKLKKPGLKVTARKGYAAPKGKGLSTAVDASVGTSVILKDLLNSPLQAAGLTLSVSAAPFDQLKDNVAVTVEIVGRNLQFKQDKGLFTNTVEVSMLPLEARGKAQQGRRSEVKLNLKPQTAQIMTATAVRMAPRLTLPPGRYQLRVAARETGGTTGSVFYDLDVPDFTKDKFNMSGVVLTAATAADHADRRARSDAQAAAARAADDAPRVLPDRRPGALRGGLRPAGDRRAAHRRRHDAAGQRHRQGSLPHRRRPEQQGVPGPEGRLLRLQRAGAARRRAARALHAAGRGEAAV